VFNISIIIRGLFLIAGTVLIYTAFRQGALTWAGLTLFVLTAIGSIGAGLFPEDVILPVHIATATLAFAGAGLALLGFGAAMSRDPRWRGYPIYTILSGIVGLIALSLFLTKTYGPLGVGGRERLIVAPVLRALIAGVHVLRWPRAPVSPVSAGRASPTSP
jgi:hypothetical membrane protein